MNTGTRLKYYLSEYEQNYSSAWNTFEQLRAERGNELPNWPDWCYCPLFGSLDIIKKEKGKKAATADVGCLGALAAWRMVKTVYRFAPETLAAVKKQSRLLFDKEKILKMPSWCIYIDVQNQDWGMPGMVGFFVFLEYDMGRYEPELRVTYDTGTCLIPSHLCITSNDLYQCYTYTLKNAYAAVCKDKHFIEVMPQEQRFEECHRFATVISTIRYLLEHESYIWDEEPRNQYPAFPYDDIAIYNVRNPL